MIRSSSSKVVIETRWLTTFLLLTACGDGGPTSNLPPPSAAVSYSLKQLEFSWPVVTGATFYKLLEDPDADGPAPYAQVGSDLSTTSVRLDIFLPGKVNALYKVSACDAVGCTDSTPISLGNNLVGAVGYFKASNTDPFGYDLFGISVTLSADGNTLAVGAGAEDSDATGVGGDQANDLARNAGAVYVFTRDDGAWSQQAYIKASNTEADDAFGSSVALSSDGNTLAVGAGGEDSSATGVNGNESDNSIENSGAVYLYTRSGSTWSQQAYVKASNPDVGDNFGYRLALSANGSALAVGAPNEDSSATGVNANHSDNSAPQAGAVYVFSRSGTAWSQEAYVKASNTDPIDYFGWSVALSGDGDTLAVGAWAESSDATGVNGDQRNNSAPTSGAVYVLTRDGSTWSQQAYVKASNPDPNDLFGWSVALAADGNTLAVGAYYEDQTGAAYVLARSGSTWSQQAYVKASNAEPADIFGDSVALSSDGNTLAVSAFSEASNATGVGGDESDNSALNAGAAYVFARSGSTWSQQAYVKASNTDADDQFGWAGSVALAGDGNTLAVGSRSEDSNATGINGDQSDNSAIDTGAVYLY
jgi:hypothetical protein